MKDFLDNLRGAIEPIEESAESQNLTLTKEEFFLKMMLEEKGIELLDLLESGEWRVAERMGLINGYIKDGEPYFDIPRWKNLVAHLRIVNSV